MALLEENNWEKHLEKLPSYEEYKKLDAVDITDYSDDYCVEKLGSTNKEDKTFCNKVSKHLEGLSLLHDNDRKNGCFYFQYWFFDQIRQKYSDDNNINNKPVSDKLFDLVALKIREFPNLESCRCYESGTPKIWKEEKDLHDYFENFKNINCTNSDKFTCEKYVRYVTYINKLFQSKEYDCCNGDELDLVVCEPYIKCKYETRPDDLLPKLQKQLKDIEAKIAEVPKGDVVGVTLGEAAEIEQNGLENTGDEVAKSAPPELTQSSPPEPKEELEEVSEVEEDELAEEGEPGPLEGETTATLQDTAPFSSQSIEDSGEAVHTAQYYTPGGARNIVPLTNSEASSTLGTTHEELDSNFFSQRHHGRCSTWNNFLPFLL